ncbi:GNAT family N-acetyltransferase [Bacillus cereus group sp. N12]|uniref:GNAT family N-acetyltransferase n=1 Tax=Bacillus cereus group sp. N12 TaxID=2794586 RepID=UPI0018F789ED|nr:GNAT family protein [Bacillus cereus group sp. N12]MBJ8075282.1 GNAT family N-acetyltransferase [Bacillus cereus group sp. N12]
MFIYQIDENITLKKLELKDAKELFELIYSSRNYLREWLPWVDTNQTVEDSEEYIKSTLQQYAENSGLRAGIYYKGNLVGEIGYYGINPLHKCASIGYWLGKEFQGKGLVTKACKVLLEYAFRELNLNRIEIRVASENYKSKAIAKRLGFTYEGCIRQNMWLYDHYVDHIVFGILKEEFNVSEGDSFCIHVES